MIEVISKSEMRAMIVLSDNHRFELHASLRNIERFETFTNTSILEYAQTLTERQEKASTIIRIFECFTDEDITSQVTTESGNLHPDIYIKTLAEALYAFISFIVAPNEITQALDYLNRIELKDASQDKKKDLTQS